MPELFGVTRSGEDVHSVTLSRDLVTIKILTFGGAIQSLTFPDKNGTVADIILGYDTVAEYEVNTPYFGFLVGRVAGRIKNAQFTLPNGRTYKVTANNDGNCLHGGTKGLSRQIWSILKETSTSVTLHYHSPDGAEGFPGNIDVSVTYSLEDGNTLHIDYDAVTDQDCPINLTNHAYFNLSGEGSANVYDHAVSILGATSPELGDDLLPTGKIITLTGQSAVEKMALLTEDRLNSIGSVPHGFDLYVIFDHVDATKPQAEVRHTASGRVVRLYTDQVGVQFYTANFLDHEPGKHSHSYNQHSAFCLETQGYPDAVNHANFPNTVLLPNQHYKQSTRYVFSHE